ncbi:MAG TPA: UDP-N-acetylmuramate--L-alanine ligase [Mesotoga infera]|uniref:UDP-N-acetylmuramate--L-alanine ligase n=1 Tax=Mesotoga infera TaxID=1236046 RepID=A0A7Z7LG10_9BACT|nr:UDP-N-acetylmuramate--L-alanine ligase [Mesotoga infera]MBP8659872.1 UDP-N-acetylmuramate--L-alanine ligase [Mesotoga sp.]NLI05808.1 UDP-N-acetylmuramate--L-alanine ligase [Thermotogaceae bacterium]SSC13405.1 UDP-N-acetylmuramate--L-alanine ligase [Mesotoga infera]HNR79855.1 UDP-N-acetylmuramate--L-alanine ligase [Mesotoga infera]HNS68191.1 UDP-N-acetylmuramate--L-alanine ligase [Mesotoga infera]
MKYHFIGIGGIGMSGLAMHLASEGYQVYGSNYEENERVEYLRARGISVFIGHSPQNFDKPDLVIRTTAIKQGNPELVRAIFEDVPTIYRMELLRKILADNISTCVTGTDGKTTTTAMVAKILFDDGRDPTVFLGGLNAFLADGNYRRGGKVIVSELDESDGFFASFKPENAIITNIRGDHLEHYDNSFENLKNHFKYFSKGVKNLLVFNADDPVSERLFKDGITFGKEKGLYRFSDRKTCLMSQTFSCWRGDSHMGQIKLMIPGEYNAYNAMAAVALTHELGVSIDTIKASLESFRSVDRRFTFRGMDNSRNLFFFDDYAHTPDEISSTIRGAREFFPDKNIIVVFQPHRYSRLVRENGRFALSLRDASEVCVYKLYEAYEKGQYAIDETEVLKGLSSYGVPAVHAVNYAEILDWLERKRDAVVLFLGAGDITEASKMSALKLCATH